MIPEIDIWCAAHLMIRQHREDASHQADARVGVLIEQGGSAGGAVWRRLREAIDKLQNDTPNGPTTGRRGCLQQHSQQ